MISLNVQFSKKEKRGGYLNWLALILGHARPPAERGRRLHVEPQRGLAGFG